MQAENSYSPTWLVCSLKVLFGLLKCSDNARDENALASETDEYPDGLQWQSAMETALTLLGRVPSSEHVVYLELCHKAHLALKR